LFSSLIVLIVSYKCYVLVRAVRNREGRTEKNKRLGVKKSTG
jgi:hypothetical protein